MTRELQQLYPLPAQSLALEGLYLSHALHRKASDNRPFVFGNFISSLDGRISLPVAGKSSRQVPAAIGNTRDWRLYQELAAQADLLVTSARYFRQFAAGEAQARLPVGEQEAYQDLLEWRHAEGLSRQPDIAILTTSLEIPEAALEAYKDRNVHVLCGDQGNAQRIAALEACGAQVHKAGPDRAVDGTRAIDRLGSEGYRSIYVIAGPATFFTLLQANAINRLYLTFAHKILAGQAFDTFVAGDELQPAQAMQLVSLYYDVHAPEGAGQLLSSYDCT